MNVLEGYLKFLKGHEKLVIIAVLVLFGLHVYDSARQTWIDHDKRQAETAHEVAQASNLQNVQVQEQLSDLKKQIDAADARTQAAMAQRAIDVQKQKEADDKLAGQELATRLQALLHVTPPDVTASPINGNLVFTPPAAHAVADAVDDKNKLTADVQDLQTRLSGRMAELAKQTDAIVSANVALADEVKSHKKDVDLMNQEMKTKWRSGFKWGFITGAVGTVIVEKVFHIAL